MRNSKSQGKSTELAEKKDSYMHLWVFHGRGSTLRINDLGRLERCKKVGDPKNEGKSTEVYENKRSKK